MNGKIVVESYKDGVLIDRIEQNMHSWVVDFTLIMFFGATAMDVSVILMDKSWITLPYNTSLNSVVRVDAPAGDDTYGILIGNGTDPLYAYDYKMSSQITNGTAAHGQVSVSGISPTGSGYQFTISRQFTNNTSSDITVTETGIAVKIGSNTPGALIVRDKLAAPILLKAGGSITVTYNIIFPV